MAAAVSPSSRGRVGWLRLSDFLGILSQRLSLCRFRLPGRVPGKQLRVPVLPGPRQWPVRVLKVPQCGSHGLELAERGGLGGVEDSVLGGGQACTRAGVSLGDVLLSRLR